MQLVDWLKTLTLLIRTKMKDAEESNKTQVLRAPNKVHVRLVQWALLSAENMARNKSQVTIDS